MAGGRGGVWQVEGQWVRQVRGEGGVWQWVWYVVGEGCG